MAEYVLLLRQWGHALNLTSRDAARQLGTHIAASLSVLDHIPPRTERIIDLGSGQGFPAIPIAIATGIAVDLIEADRRKAAFLTTVLAKLGLAGTVWPSRIETVHIAPAACVTARALAPLADLIRMARPFLLAEGCGLFLKGAAAEAELEAARAVAVFEAAILPAGDPPSRLVKITALG